MRFYGLGGVCCSPRTRIRVSCRERASRRSAKADRHDDGQPKATDLIFERKHLAKVDAGKQIEYKFNRTASDEKVLGSGFSDDITLKVTADKPTTARRTSTCRSTPAIARAICRSSRSSASIRCSRCSSRRRSTPSISSPAAR